MGMINNPAKSHVIDFYSMQLCLMQQKPASCVGLNKSMTVSHMLLAIIMPSVHIKCGIASKLPVLPLTPSDWSARCPGPVSDREECQS